MKSKLLKEILEWVVTIVIALGLAYGIRLFVIQPFRVQMSSMHPTLYNDDLILINKLAYIGSSPQRGDIIVFDPPNRQDVEYIKRVIGLPGEWIEVDGSQVFINGQEFIEVDDHTKTDYTQKFAPAQDEKKGIHLEQDQFFVMGDNRGGSFDSRSFGPIKRASILGRAVLVFWPVNRFHVLR